MICVCYCLLSKCKFVVFLILLVIIFELMYNLRWEIVVIGDLNFDLFLDYNDIKKFKELCDQFQLINLIEMFIRVIEFIVILFDFIFFSYFDYYVKCGLFYLGISDYDLIYIVRKQRFLKFFLK